MEMHSIEGGRRMRSAIPSDTPTKKERGRDNGSARDGVDRSAVGGAGCGGESMMEWMAGMVLVLAVVVVLFLLLVVVLDGM
jgi:hypothetical protein